MVDAAVWTPTGTGRAVERAVDVKQVRLRKFFVRAAVKTVKHLFGAGFAYAENGSAAAGVFRRSPGRRPAKSRLSRSCRTACP